MSELTGDIKVLKKMIDNVFTAKNQVHDIFLWAFFIFNCVLSGGRNAMRMLELVFVILRKIKKWSIVIDTPLQFFIKIL